MRKGDREVKSGSNPPRVPTSPKNPPPKTPARPPQPNTPPDRKKDSNKP